MYAITIDENKRILSATFPEYAPDDAILVERLPDGDITDYLYQNGEFVISELPKQEEPEKAKTVAELADENKRLTAQLTMQEEKLTMLEDCLLELGDTIYA